MDKIIRVAVARVLNNTDLTLAQKQGKLLEISLLVWCREDVSEETKTIVDKWYDTLKAYNVLNSL